MQILCGDEVIGSIFDSHITRRAEAEPGARGETAEIEEISADTTDQVGLTEDLSAEEGELPVLVRGTEGGL